MTKPKSKERRKKSRRKEDRAKRDRILHIAKRLVGLENVFNQEVDALLEELGINRAEVM